ILIAILVAARRNPWYEYAIVGTVGSVIGAIITYHLARKAEGGDLESKFGKARVAALLRIFEKWTTGTLVLSSAIPFPFPTSPVSAAAGVSKYQRGRYIAVVAASRAFRYTVIALLADLYGRQFIRIFRHPMQSWGWILAVAAILLILTVAAVFLNKRIL